MTKTKSPIDPEDTEALVALGRALYGATWQPALARDVGYSATHVWEIAAGRQPVTKRLRVRLARLVADAVRGEEGFAIERKRVLATAASRFSSNTLGSTP